MTEPISPPRRTLLRLAASGCGALAATAAMRPARAEDTYPSRVIRVVVPYPAGGVVDVVTRTVTEKMATSMGQPIVVEAKPGASANIGTETVLRSPPDGYNLLMGAPFLATNPILMPGITKWKTTDFVGLGLIGAPPNLFVVPASLPVRSLRELVDYVKAHPGQVNVANPGIGTSNHMGQELFFSITGLEMQNVMYKGQPEMIPDIVSGQITFSLLTLALGMPHVKEGKLRALAISAPRRSPDLPDVPTLAEAGYGEAMFLPWYGLVAVAATPKPIVKRLSDEIMKALAMPETVSRLEKMGAQVTPADADAFDKLMAGEVQRWTQVIKVRNIRPVS